MAMAGDIPLGEVRVLTTDQLATLAVHGYDSAQRLYAVLCIDTESTQRGLMQLLDVSEDELAGIKEQVCALLSDKEAEALQEHKVYPTGLLDERRLATRDSEGDSQ